MSRRRVSALACARPHPPRSRPRRSMTSRAAVPADSARRAHSAARARVRARAAGGSFGAHLHVGARGLGSSSNSDSPVSGFRILREGPAPRALGRLSSIGGEHLFLFCSTYVYGMNTINHLSLYHHRPPRACARARDSWVFLHDDAPVDFLVLRLYAD
jgi:hypothetical protein